MPVSAPDKRLGVGQTWQDVTASRAKNTAYTNTSGKPIGMHVTVEATANAQTLEINVDGQIVGSNRSFNASAIYLFCIVPANGVYSVSGTFGGAITKWRELK